MIYMLTIYISLEFPLISHPSVPELSLVRRLPGPVWRWLGMFGSILGPAVSSLWPGAAGASHWAGSPVSRDDPTPAPSPSVSAPWIM